MLLSMGGELSFSCQSLSSPYAVKTSFLVDLYSVYGLEWGYLLLTDMPGSKRSGNPISPVGNSVKECQSISVVNLERRFNNPWEFPLSQQTDIICMGLISLYFAISPALKES